MGGEMYGHICSAGAHALIWVGRWAAGPGGCRLGQARGDSCAVGLSQGRREDSCLRGSVGAKGKPWEISELPDLDGAVRKRWHPVSGASASRRGRVQENGLDQANWLGVLKRSRSGATRHDAFREEARTKGARPDPHSPYPLAATPICWRVNSGHPARPAPALTTTGRVMGLGPGGT